jgi:hypothetical protein
LGQQLRISAKVLAELAMPDFCPRCFWVKRQVPDRLPYQSFPGIFSSIDSFSKKVVHGWFDKGEGAPAWLEALGKLAGYKQPPHHSRFRIVDDDNDILLTGVPDGVFVRPDQSHVIVDYKTSRYTPYQERLFPLYEAQLNAYALIGEQCGLEPVSSLALIYTEPATSDIDAAGEGVHRKDGFAMGFVAHVVPVDLNTSIIPPLLAKVRELCDSKTSPSGRRNCRNCRLLNELLDVAGS